MTAYYNEIDPFAAQWLRNLIAAGHIAPGEVDERSILDVRPDDLAGYTQCHFFAGIGGWSYARRMAAWGDDQPVWTGSCPCQPFSLAGKQKGFDDDRHLWPIWRELIRECRPARVFGEQVASAAAWLGLVRSDLEAMGYAVGAVPVQAASAGADHLRDRIWFVGHADSERGEVDPDAGGSANGSSAGTIARLSGAGYGDVADSAGGRQHGSKSSFGAPRRDSSQDSGLDWVIGADGKARRVKPGICLLAHGVPARVGKLRGFGNAIDPRPASKFIKAYASIQGS